MRNNDVDQDLSLISKLIEANQCQKFNGDLRNRDPEETYYEVYYPFLSVAVLKRNLTMLTILLEYDFKPHAISSALNPETTPLIEASRCGRVDMVLKLTSILNKDELNYYDHDIKNSALYYAIQNNLRFATFSISILLLPKNTL
ncbi:Ankyrin repeat [Rickettsia akari str. Hartford]|uniref:Ankyrin repeat n=1 Tax=Rickettsia akari (strain Hartford) TaxID=293614 RepID=A8GNY8_RICAH|nr:ankyrin repeat domain-containing protein [Rickettsia akari]ABV75113.1 Ankyrin repeat [Rickettsia akari str. Hartford]